MADVIYVLRMDFCPEEALRLWWGGAVNESPSIKYVLTEKGGPS